MLNALLLLRMKNLAKIRVESLFEQGSSVINEDFLVIEGNLFGVFDGATSLDGATYEHGYTGGFLAANLAGEVFKKGSGSLEELSEQANQALRRAMVERNVNLADKGGLWSTSAAVARIRDNELEWAQIGDCQIVCIRDGGDIEIPCECSDQDVETLSLWKETCRTTDAPIGEAMHDQILKVRSTMNVAYGALSGEPEAMDFLNSGTLDLEGVSHVLLFTDGLFLPNANPWIKRDFSEHARLFRRDGLKGIRDHIRSIEARDMGCQAYPRFKAHDDIAAVAIHM